MPVEPTSASPCWFPAKAYGWGWGPPTCWQGVLVLVAFVALVAANAILFPPAVHPVAFLCGTGRLVAALCVCFLKGEPPAWRWGGSS